VDVHKTAISIGCTKETALLFEEVVPVLLPLEIPLWEEFTVDTSRVVSHQIMPPQLLEDDTFHTRLRLLNFLMLKEWDSPHGAISSAQKGFASLIEEYGLSKLSIITHSNTIQDDDDGDVALVLRNLNVIDVERTPWKQIQEFREDAKARQQLRRLRLFAYENYEGKSKLFVEDDLHARLYDYDELIRRWGFETKQAVLSSILRSKGLSGALGGALIATLFGAPTAALASAVGGAVLEIGRVSLEIAKRKFSLSSSLHDNPVSYVAELRTRFGPPNGFGKGTKHA
jgi:hypothetical protein